MLVITLLIMGGATFAIGLLPSFEFVGILAPILLVVLRFLQGFAVGGEWGGATLMAVEHAPEDSRNFYASWPQLGPGTALILSSAVFAVFSTLPDEQFFRWGWRVPFLLSIALIGVGLLSVSAWSSRRLSYRSKNSGLNPTCQCLRCCGITQ
jgi:MFS family permease